MNPSWPSCLDQWPHFIAPANNNISSVLNLSRIDKSTRHWRLPGASVDFPEVAAMANNRTLNDSDARRPHKTDPLLDQFQSAGCTRVIVGCRYVCLSVGFVYAGAASFSVDLSILQLSKRESISNISVCFAVYSHQCIALPSPSPPHPRARNEIHCPGPSFCSVLKLFNNWMQFRMSSDESDEG